MATEIWVNIGPGNGLLPDGTKPLPEPVLTDHQWGFMTFIWGQFLWKRSIYISLKISLKITKLRLLPRANELKKKMWWRQLNTWGCHCACILSSSGRCWDIYKQNNGPVWIPCMHCVMGASVSIFLVAVHGVILWRACILDIEQLPQKFLEFVFIYRVVDKGICSKAAIV